MRYLSLLSLLACAAAPLALPAADAGRKAIPFDYDQYDLPNGLRVFTVRTDAPGVVTMHVTVQTGSRNEVEPGRSGFAHFFEHMMFRGTKKFPPEKFQAVLREAGAANNAFTSDDITSYHATFTKTDLEKIMEIEADRFQNLEYAEAAFKTEALAVLGEYNKNSASPYLKMLETLRGAAFSKHTYQHTTMGFLKDIQDMPNQFAYSREFFNRFYRPEYTTILVVGDADPKHVRALADRYWSKWQRGSYQAPIPTEPPLDGPKQEHIRWPNPTLPYCTVAYRSPAFTDTEKDSAALDIISFLGFSENSPLYKRLVIEEQRVDTLQASNTDRVDPYLFVATARIKKDADIESIRDQIISTLAGFKDTLAPVDQLDRVKRRLRYELQIGMDASDTIARTLVHYVGLRRTPESLNRLANLYDSITPEDLRDVARKYFREKNRIVVTLSGASK